MTNPSKPKILLDQIRDTIRLKYHSYSTKKTYVYWARRYILFYNKRHPDLLGAVEVETFLMLLSTEECGSSTKQNLSVGNKTFGLK